jgi:hypothetical protein
MEVERGHDRGHRGATGLVSADFQAVGAIPDMVCMMDRLLRMSGSGGSMFN